jgi:hypothetical protein
LADTETIIVRVENPYAVGPSIPPDAEAGLTIQVSTAKDPDPKKWNSVYVGPGSTRSNTRLRIPRCANVDEFNDDHLEVYAKPESGTAGIWELQYAMWVAAEPGGGSVRCSPGEFSADAPKVPGNARIGGENVLRINQDQDFNLTLSLQGR